MIPTLETERLVLRGFALADFDVFADIWGNEEVTRYITGEPQTRRESWDRFLKNAGFWMMLGHGYWAVVEKAADHVVGLAGFIDGKRELGADYNGYPEAGWVFGPDSCGKGFATEAVLAAHRWMDERDVGKRTVCMIDPVHAGSIRVAVKCGYEEMRRTADDAGAVLLMVRN